MSYLRINFHMEVDSSSSMASPSSSSALGILWSSCIMIRPSSSHKSESLSTYSMTIRSFVLVEGRLWVNWHDRCSSHLEWYLLLPLHFQSHQDRHLLSRYPRVGDLRHRYWHSPLRCPEDRGWELSKMCRKDICYFRPLGFGGLRLRLGSPLPFVHLHIGGLTMMC